MMKKLVALLMALALLCSSIGAFATEEAEPVAPVEEAVQEEAPAAADPSTEPSTEPSPKPAEVEYDITVKDGDHTHVAFFTDKIGEEVKGNCLVGTYTEYKCRAEGCTSKNVFKYYKVAALPEHKSATSTTTTEPTCTTKGVKTWVCSACGDTWTEEIDKLGHDYKDKLDEEDKPIVIKPTCTEIGYTLQVCSRCGLENKANTKPATGHKWAVNTENWKGEDRPTDVFTPAEDVSQVDSIPAPYLFTEFKAQDCVGAGHLVQFAVCETCHRKVVKIEKTNDMTQLDHAARIKKLTERLVDKDTGKEETDAAYFARMLKLFCGANATIDADFDGTFEDEPIKNVEGDASFNGAYGKLKVSYVAPTCVKEGVLTVKCSTKGCGAEFVLTTPAKGHTYTFSKKEKPTSCTGSGYVLVECACGFSEKVLVEGTGEHTRDLDPDHWTYTQKKYGALADKSLDEDTLDATHTLALCQPYTKHIPCLGCDVIVKLSNDQEVKVHIDCKETIDVEMDETKDNEHVKNQDSRIYKAATCESDGYDYFYCSQCGTSEGSGVIPKLNHKYEGKEVVTKPASCTESGTLRIYCINCQNDKTKKPSERKYIEEKIPATGHKYVDGEGKKATCTVDGYTLKVCVYCGDKKETKVAAHHKWPENIEELSKKPGSGYSYTAPTCTTDGSRSYPCEDCGFYVSEKIDKLGHSWERADYVTENSKKNLAYDEKHNEYYDKIVPATCMKDSYYLRECKDCKDAKGKPTKETCTIEGTKLPHNIKTLILDTKNLPTCEKEGTATFQCGTPNCTYVGTITLPKLPHNEIVAWDKVSKSYKVTCETPLTANDYVALMQKNNYLKDVVASYTEEEKVDDVLNGILTEIAKRLVNEKAIGCKMKEDVEVAKTNYTPAIDIEKGIVTLKPDANCPLLAKPYVTVLWTFKDADGEVTSFCRGFSEDKDLGDLTFDIGECSVDGYELVSIRVVVTDKRVSKVSEAAKSMYGTARYPEN